MNYIFRFPTLIILILIGMGYGCKPTKYLQGDEKLLVKNKVVIKNDLKNDLPKNLSYDLSTLYKQRVNDHYLIFWSSVGIYEKNHQRQRDQKKSQKWREKRGEPLAIYDANKSEETRTTMVYYLNNLGYFKAEVGFEEIPSGNNQIGVQYIVKPGPLYQVKTATFKSVDERVDRLIKSIANKTLLKEGAAINEDIFAKEYERILGFMNNNGYAKMGKNHLITTGDSTASKVDVTIEVLSPNGAPTHTRYAVGSINVYPEYVAGIQPPILLDTLVDGVYFKYYNREPNVLPEVILRNIYLRTGIRYSKELTIKTERLLSNLNVFRLVTVKAIPRENDESIFDYDIFLSPRKKLGAGFDFDLNQTTNTFNGSRTLLLGTGFNFNIRDYNAFHEGIQLSFGARLGTDVNLAAFADDEQNWFYGADGSLNVGISVPRFVRWLGPYTLLNRIGYGKENEEGGRKHVLSNKFLSTIKESGKTTHNVRVEYRKIFNFYSLVSFDAEIFKYNIPISNKSALNVTHSGVTVFLPEKDSIFMALADSNQYLNLSFSRQLFTGLFFKNFNFSHTTGSTNINNKWDFRWNLELSGLEMFAANSLINIGGGRDTIRLFNQFEFSQFARTDFTISQNKKLTERSDFAFRYQMGIARAFGFSNEVPYLRQFFGGGPNSMRGWKIRELGPGGFQDEEGITQGNFFQAADFQIETNFEYRFPLFGYFKGALFIDAGNIWTLSKDDPRVNSQFRFREKKGTDGTLLTPFYKQIAITSGFGFRFDYAYFVIRLDSGIKLRNPYKVNNSYWLPDFNDLPIGSFSEFFDIFNFNLAIAYPF